MIAADPLVRAAIEAGLAGLCPHSLVVTTQLDGAAALRSRYPDAHLVLVGARRDQVVAVLDAGADVVLTGPLRVAELRARVRALERRSAGGWLVGPLVFDPRSRIVVLDGSEVSIPRREFAILCRLAARPGRVFTKAELLRDCWESGDHSCGSRTLERQVARLRARLGRHHPMLVTVWGIGYRLERSA